MKAVGDRKIAPQVPNVQHGENRVSVTTRYEQHIAVLGFELGLDLLAGESKWPTTWSRQSRTWLDC